VGGSKNRRSVGTLVERAAANDGTFRSHSWNVATLSVRLGKALGLRKRELEILELAAVLHDVGKLGVPSSVIAKTGALDEREWRAMRRHPVDGEQLLAPHMRSDDVLEIIRSHHERWDGRGYPDGLKGEQIPLGARIVAVADAFCAMIERRPYRAPRPRAAARAELLEQAGRQFDPVCAGAAYRVTGGSR
jgi:putative nucleotidyltransferase with HDIG domain